MSDAPADVQPEESVEVETDWKAEAEKLKSESRKWEQRSKENAAAARRLAEIEDATKTETQKLTERAESAERELAQYRLEAQITGWRTQVATESGVPADALRGQSLEELQAHAETLKPLLNARQHPYVPSPGNTPQTAANADQMWAASVFNKT